jgi:hypothetical protein
MYLNIRLFKNLRQFDPGFHIIRKLLRHFLQMGLKTSTYTLQFSESRQQQQITAMTIVISDYRYETEVINRMDCN